MPRPEPDWEFKERDVVILRELAKDPQISSRALRDVLAEEYDIDVSHVTVSESIRKMREREVFRDVILPNERYFRFALFEYKFDLDHFETDWREAMEYIRDDEHTLLYFLSDGEYQWKSIMMFPDSEHLSRWLHEFYKAHGSAFENVRISSMMNVLKFGTDPSLFDEIYSRDGV